MAAGGAPDLDHQNIGQGQNNENIPIQVETVNIQGQVENVGGLNAENNVVVQDNVENQENLNPEAQGQVLGQSEGQGKGEYRSENHPV